jgi:uncharacterized membrane protein SpoIIM required for sporulation/uncharacterized RDD family membrane protein YckC
MTAETEKLDTLQAVELAEGIEIRLRMAGPMLRAAAYFIDLLIRGAVMLIGGIGVGLAGFAIGGSVATGVMLLAWFLMDWLYPVIFEAGKRGATPGKRVLGLRVVQASGSPITLGQAVIRNFLRFIDGMPMFTYLFGLSSCLATQRFQRLGDLAAGTVVIYDRIPPLPIIAAPPPMVAVPVPLALTVEETRALTRFRERAGLWSEGRRVEIADQASELSGATGMAGVNRLMAMAHWALEKAEGATKARSAEPVEGDFENLHQARWAAYERVVTAVERRENPAEAAQLPRLFREVSFDLALAESRMVGARITERLNQLVIRGYEIIYQARRTSWEHVVSFVVAGFPQAVRREWRLFWLCSAVFWIPFVTLLLSPNHDIRWIQAILGADGMASMEQMYAGREEQLTHLRSEHGSNFMMFCFYIYNNVAIDFRVFAGGMAAGLGTLFYLLFNGLHLGAAAGYANHACNPESFWSFVAGHSSFELLGMIVAGMAGMRLGLAILRPGRLPRVRALVEASKQALPLICGAALMTTLAAVVEGFWSAQGIPSNVKYAVGGVAWALHIGYFLLAGRRTRHAA